jgi:hypothetical protein
MKDCFGLTEDGKKHRFTVTLHEDQGPIEAFNTFFHEMVHVYFNVTDQSSKEHEERIARLVGNAAEAIAASFHKEFSRVRGKVRKGKILYDTTRY